MSLHQYKKKGSVVMGLNAISTLCAALLSAGAMAADDFAFDGEDYLSELPVVLTVTRLPQSRAELPTAVTVIDRQMIAASGAVELTELFRLVAGFQVGHYHDTDGSRDAVTYHGNTNQYSRRMQVLIDGRSVYTWGTGGAEWGDLPIAIDDIERIEVSRGPNGVTYGSNAFLGVINIITRHPAEQQGTHASVTLDDDQYRKAVLRYAASSGDLSYRVTVGHKQDDGFEDYRAGSSFDELNDDTQTASLNLRADYRGGVNDYWTLQFGGSAGPREVGLSADPVDPVRERDVTTHFQQLQWKHIIDSDSEVNAQLYHHLHRVEDRYKTGLLSSIFTAEFEDDCIPVATVAECAFYPFDSADVSLLLGFPDQVVPRDTSMQSERYDLELSHRFRLSDAVRLVWGGEFRVDEVTAVDYFDLGETYQHRQSRLFFNGEWKPTEQWVVNVGDMVEQSSVVGTLHSPRVAINRLVGDAGYLRMSGGRAHRTPAALEEYANFTARLADGSLFRTLYESPGELAPERIDSVEFAFGTETLNAGYEVKIFREEISSEIDAPINRAVSHWTLANVGETTVEGTEIQLKAKTEDSLFSLAYSNTRAYGWRITELNPQFIEGVEDAVPRQTLNALLSYRVANKLWAGMNYYSVSPMQFYSGDKTERFQSLDFTLSKGLVVAEHEAKVSVMVKNVLGSYYDFEEETVSNRRVYLTLTMDL